MGTTAVGEQTREYIQRFPNASTLALARMLVRDFPSMYSFNSARASVKLHRGLKKNGSGRVVENAIPFTPDTLPTSHSEDILPWKLDARGCGTIISDVHIPYHDMRSLSLVLNHAVKKKQTDFLIINGDLCDFYGLSQFSKDPRKRHFADEIADCQKFLRTAVREFKRVVYKFGNHEVRYSAYMYGKAPELLSLPGMELHKIFQSVENPDADKPPLIDEEIAKVKFIPASTIIQAGALTILHGHEYGKSMMSPVNPARGMFLRATACTISGHLHRTSQHVERTIQGKNIVCWSTGCLCGLTPEYAPMNKWDHSGAFLDFNGKDFDIHSVRVIDGKVY